MEKRGEMGARSCRVLLWILQERRNVTPGAHLKLALKMQSFGCTGEPLLCNPKHALCES